MKKLYFNILVFLFTQTVFPQLTLTSPIGGEVWLTGSTQAVSWMDANPNGYVNLDYSSDGGTIWNRFANSVSSMYPSYSWWLPTIPSINYKVRVTDVNNALNFSESALPFSIVDKLPGTVTLTYPNGGEVIYNGSQQTITWISGNVSTVNLYFSPDSGKTWNSIASNISASLGSYISAVNASSTTNALIRISDAADAQVFDESDAVFTIVDTISPKIQVTFPNGGEIFPVGVMVSIAWTTSSMSGNSNIDYSTDNGYSWTNIATNLPSMYPVYMWYAPNTVSSTCKIRVYDAANPSISDESDNVFSINDMGIVGGAVAYYNFNGNTLDHSGNGHDGMTNGAVLTGDRFSNPNSAYLFSGNSKISVPNSTQLNFSNGKFTFALWMKQDPSNSTFNCILGKDYSQEYGFGTWGVSAAAPTYPRLIISGKETPSNFLSPITCGVWYHVAVTFDDAADEVKFYINGVLTETSTNTGSMTATTTELGIGSDGVYNDQFSGTLDDIRMFDRVLSPAEILAIFNDTITTPPILKLDSPNGGEVLVAGTVDTIHWSANYLTQVSLDYTTDNGATWTNIAGSMPAEYPSGYEWLVPNTLSAMCKVRVTDNSNPNMFDESDGTFTISAFKCAEYTVDANTVLLDHFNGVTDASILGYSPSGQPCGTEWPSVTPSYYFVPGMNELNTSLTLSPPFDAIGGSASYLKYPGGQLLSQANGTIEFYVKLSSYGKGLGLVNQAQYFGACYGWTFDMHIDSVGTLYSGAWAAFNLTSGSTKVPLNRWTHLAVTWGSTGAKLYIDGMLVGSDGNTGMPALGYGGSLLMTLGTGAGVNASIDELRVSNIQRTEFTIVPQSILSVISPNGGEKFQPNTPVYVEWNASNISAFNLEYTSDNGATWNLICDTLTNASPAFLWYTPYIESDLMRIRISDKFNANTFDESDSNFTVTNKITQFIPLYYSGWNMVSLYVQPVSNLPRDVFSSSLILQVKTELQSFDPSLPEFLNTLKGVYAGQGYLVNSDSAEQSFSVLGDPFHPFDGINYRAGWNLMSYYYSYPESIWYGLEPIIGSVEEIKTMTSYYNPMGTTETNTLYTLEPGQAYWIKLKNNVNGFTFPYPQVIMPKKHKTAGQKLMAELPWKLKGYTQSTVALFTVTSDGKPVKEGSVVAAFVNGECRAIAEVKLNNEGTSFVTLVINGEKEEEAQFKIYDAEKKESFGSNLKIRTKPGTTLPGVQKLPFTFITGITDPMLPTTTALMNAYPNPFNPETRIQFSVIKSQNVSLKVYDVLGKEVLTLVDETKEPGYYEIGFNASGLPSGIYFYRMQSGEYVSVKKLLLLK